MTAHLRSINATSTPATSLISTLRQISSSSKSIFIIPVTITITASFHHAFPTSPILQIDSELTLMANTPCGFIHQNDHQFLEAVKDGDFDRMNVLANGLDVGGVRGGKKGVTALHLAACGGYLQICQSLVGVFELDVNARDKNGETPLYVACFAGQHAIVEYLLDQGADPNRCKNDGRTPLHVAAYNGNEEILHLLFARNVEVNVNSELGTPLREATVQGRLQAVAILLEHHASPDLSYRYYSPPILASMLECANPLPCLELLLQFGANPNDASLGVTPLEIAASNGQVEITRCLLGDKADPNLTNATGQTPMDIAAIHDKGEIVKILFPLTFPSPFYPDWSYDGIMTYATSEEAEQQREVTRGEVLAEMRVRAREAFRRKDYSLAEFLLSKIIFEEPAQSANVYACLSHCNAHVKRGDGALANANNCIGRLPTNHFPVSVFFYKGTANALLGNYDEAAHIFEEGLQRYPHHPVLSLYQERVQARIDPMDQCPCFDYW